MSHARLTTWYANQLLSLLLGAGTWSQTVQPHAALLTSIGEWDAVTEPEDEAYVRAAMPLTSSTAAVVRNSAAAAFPVLTTSVTLAGLGLYSSATAGQLLAIHTFDEAMTVPLGRQLRIDALQWSLRVRGSIAPAVLDDLLNHTLHGTSWSPVTSLQLALLTAYTSDSTWAEQSGLGYEAQPITWTSVANGATSNSIAAQFAAATDAWTRLTHLALIDAGSPSRLLCRKRLPSPQPAEPGRPFHFEAGAIELAIV